MLHADMLSSSFSLLPCRVDRILRNDSRDGQLQRVNVGAVKEDTVQQFN